MGLEPGADGGAALGDLGLGDFGFEILCIEEVLNDKNPIAPSQEEGSDIQAQNVLLTDRILLIDEQYDDDLVVDFSCN